MNSKAKNLTLFFLHHQFPTQHSNTDNFYAVFNDKTKGRGRRN